jgi:hypothetical protein
MTEFKRTYTSVNIGDGAKRHKVRLEDQVDTTKGSLEARMRFFRILDTLVTTPDLGTVGPAMVCDSSSLTHDGTRWVLELEAITYEGR